MGKVSPLPNITPKLELILCNKNTICDNYLHLDNSGRFLFQSTYDKLYIYDLLWKVQGKIDLPENSDWFLFFMLKADNKIVIGRKETDEKSRILLVECQLDYQLLNAKILHKYSFPVNENTAETSAFQFSNSSILQEVSPIYIGIFSNFCDIGRNFLLVDTRDMTKRKLVQIPQDIRCVRFAILVDKILYFFGHSMQKMWHLKRLYSINIETGTMAELPLSSVMKEEDRVLNIQITDGAWNHYLQRFSLTLHTNKESGSALMEHQLLILDLPSRTWQHLDISNQFATNSVFDVKHRIDSTNESTLLMMNEAHKFTNKTLIHRILIKEPLRLSQIAFNAVLLTNPGFIRLDSQKLRNLGVPLKLHPLFKPTSRFNFVKSFLLWTVCLLFLVFGGYYFVEALFLSYTNINYGSTRLEI